MSFEPCYHHREYRQRCVDCKAGPYPPVTIAEEAVQWARACDFQAHLGSGPNSNTVIVWAPIAVRRLENTFRQFHPFVDAEQHGLYAVFTFPPDDGNE